MSRIVLGLSYDGSGWYGWQTQRGGRTLQDTLEAALSTFLAVPSVATICAGRTDTGVHALQQIVHLDTDAVRRDESWVRGLNAHLPASVSVQWAQAAASDFHARFDARARTYFYVLRSAPVRSPMLHGRVGWVHDRLDDQAMREAAGLLLGEHDFSAFRSSECQASSPVRTMQALEIIRQGDFLVFEFRANAFLHHMVRNLMGTLIMIGRGRRPPDWAGDLLTCRDRKQAAPTFMPDGLYLAHVAYPQAPYLPIRPAADALRHHLGAWWPESRE
ncbi:tRNA pseudouridine(38-40) synthase TruA [Castellaniella sp.]|uniref:tRNA pseudouridine(38-40) synthase TruA n=1 Tax=Castellaniella sp. TaxID=1955812 RepID=UPI002AFEF0B0|nr:tRNA pseudouridine(38-40) synthase TruA [Castellaniella sp.]